MPGIISAALHRSKDGARVVNYAHWKSDENWENLARIANESRFGEMGEFAKPDAHLYEVCYLLAKTDKPGEVGGPMRSVDKMFLFIAVSLMLAERAVPRTQTAQANIIHVEVEGLRNDKGQAVCDLFSSAPDFPKKRDKAVAHGTSVITNRRAVCEFPSVTPGTYAVSVFHDENSNGKLDTNFMGIPREGVGASNDAKGHFGPPKFDAAAFGFAGGRLELKITINYL